MEKSKTYLLDPHFSPHDPVRRHLEIYWVTRQEGGRGEEGKQKGGGGKEIEKMILKKEWGNQTTLVWIPSHLWLCANGTLSLLICKMRISDTIYLIGFLWELRKLKYTKSLEWCLSQGKQWKNIIYTKVHSGFFFLHKQDYLMQIVLSCVSTLSASWKSPCL